MARGDGEECWTGVLDRFSLSLWQGRILGPYPGQNQGAEHVSICRGLINYKLQESTEESYTVRCEVHR